MFAIYKDHFKEEFEKLFKEAYPSGVQLTFKDADNPFKKPHSKAEVIAVTAVLNFEKPSCL
jgi:hypothetical protein